MGQYITTIDVSTKKNEESELDKKGFTKIPVNLNPGNKANGTFLWYNTIENQPNTQPITRIQFSFTEGMEKGLKAQKYQKVDQDLTDGTGERPIYLWFFRGTTRYDAPIVQLFISTDAASDAEMVQPLWERSACNLNRAGGKWFHLWMKRSAQAYVCDVTATNNSAADADLFRKGYIRIDENLNKGAGGEEVFIWYRQTTDDDDLIRDLQISTNPDEVKSLQGQYYQQVSTNLSKRGANVFLWYKKECGKKPINMVTLLVDQAAVPLFKIAKATVITKDLKPGIAGTQEFLCFN
ncbi:PREDICTED: uncharacterized protein LOC107099648 [Cyprinodon variegatus]|uniref:uncharacterized protein LOC107099648 n=1 Tax=Cyprinodon variegatus TaxID=28743 RepID=UPI000742AFA0|nr:PREDICTED: uncharacterized protein LOC107099648 [Cyprinodon variegatus]